MRSYGQFCAIARALEVVGDRWTLLVVRELLDGPRRYGELQRRLPGIATNLLGQRLRSLAEAGVVVHGDDGRYALTEWGAGLREVLYAVGRWGMPLMAPGAGGDAFHVDWLRHLVAMHFDRPDDRRADGVVELRCGDGAATVIVVGGRVLTAPGPVGQPPDAVVAGPPDALGGYITGFLTRSDAVERGVEITGASDVVEALARSRAAAG